MRAAVADWRQPPVLLSSHYDLGTTPLTASLSAPAGSLVVLVACTGSGREAVSVSDTGGHEWQRVAAPDVWASAVVEVYSTRAETGIDGQVTVTWDGDDDSIVICLVFAPGSFAEFEGGSIKNFGGTQGGVTVSAVSDGLALALAVCGIGAVRYEPAIDVDPTWRMIESSGHGRHAAVASRLARPSEQVEATFSNFSSNVDAGIVFLRFA